MLLELISTGVVSLIVGVFIGAHNVVTVDRAIAAVTAAESNAKAVLSKITAHKAT